MATGDAPLPLHSPPLRHGKGGLNVLARHILLTLCLHHCGLHLPDPQLPAPQAAAPAPKTWAETAPEEVADYLQHTCCRFQTAFGRQKGTAYPLSALLYPADPAHPTQLRPPGSWASFRDAHLAAPSEITAARMDPADQRAYVRGLEACLREAHRWHTRALSGPRRRVRSPAPKPTRPRRPTQARGPASAPTIRARHPDRNQGPATPHKPTSKPLGYTNSNTLTSAHHHHRNVAP